MSDTKATKDGGSAFPQMFNTARKDGMGGMTLRDYFAGQALIGCFNFWVQVNARTTIGDPDQQAITRLAYEYADAMLAARESSS